MIKLLGLDPGGSTGWASYDDTNAINWKQGQLGPGPHHDELYDLMYEAKPQFLDSNRIDPLIVICESFQYRNNLDKAELDSVEYIGVVKYWRTQEYNVQVVWQTPAEGKIREDLPGRKGSFVQRRHLEKLGLWIPGQRHAMDALGHIIYYIVHSGNPELRDLRSAVLKKAWRPNASR